MLCILKAFAAWIGLVFVSINLIGSVVKGFFLPVLPVDGSTDRVAELLERESQKYYAWNHFWTLLMVGLNGAFLYALYYYWNAWLVIAAALIMLGRLPDLLWECRHGKQVPKPQGVAYLLGIVLVLAALPVVWYALCRVSAE